MKLMIASDIHGSAPCCRALLERYRAEGADRLVLLGDLLYHGPRNDLPDGYAPKEVIAQLSELKNEILCVRGNCDTEVDQMVLPFSTADIRYTRRTGTSTVRIIPRRSATATSCSAVTRTCRNTRCTTAIPTSTPARSRYRRRAAAAAT